MCWDSPLCRYADKAWLTRPSEWMIILSVSSCQFRLLHFDNGDEPHLEVVQGYSVCGICHPQTILAPGVVKPWAVSLVVLFGLPPFRAADTSRRLGSAWTVALRASRIPWRAPHPRSLQTIGACVSLCAPPLLTATSTHLAWITWFLSPHGSLTTRCPLLTAAEQTPHGMRS